MSVIEVERRRDENGAIYLNGVCILCRNRGEVWISGRMEPCHCDSVQALNHRLQERIAELEAALASRGDPGAGV